MVIIQCTKCKKKFHVKKDKVAYVKTKPYCQNCYGNVANPPKIRGRSSSWLDMLFRSRKTN